MSNHSLPRETVSRLPKYLRYLREFALEGKAKVSSSELADRLGITASQVRRDLGQIGVNGHNGFGYIVSDAHRCIAAEIGLYSVQRVAIIGAGNIGHALTTHRMFNGRGFALIGIYDRQPERIGCKVGQYIVEDIKRLEQLTPEQRPDIAVLAVSSENANQAAQFLVKLGIHAILNFCYTDLQVPESVLVENIHIDDSLMMLSYQLTHRKP